MGNGAPWRRAQRPEEPTTGGVAGLRSQSGWMEGSTARQPEHTSDSKKV